jgi:HEPN domain-containing protein
MDANNAKKLAQEWFDKGDADIEFARLGFGETEHFGQVCFLSQQAIEKYLKGFLVAKAKVPKRIHSISALIKECVKLDRRFSKFAESSKTIDSYYIPTRYPVGLPHDFSKSDGKKAISIADEIIELVNELV